MISIVILVKKEGAKYLDAIVKEIKINYIRFN